MYMTLRIPIHTGMVCKMDHGPDPLSFFDLSDRLLTFLHIRFALQQVCWASASYRSFTEGR